MIPANAIAVIRGKGVMVVVIAFTKSEQGDQCIIDGAEFASIGFRSNGVTK